MEGAIGFPNAYLLDSDLSREYHYLTNQVLQYCPIQFTGMDEMDACGIYDQKEEHFSTCCHSDHVFHKINSSHHLSDGMFYLQASVHFQEVEIFLRVNQALNSTSRVISNFLSKSYSLLTHGFPHVWVHKWTARKQMLVFSLTIQLYDCLGLRTNIVTL